MTGPRIPVDLAGVPETMLWTLYFRSLEARRPDRLLPDPLAVELVERMDYPFAERLGSGDGRGQWQALRSATFDAELRRFLRERPGATVVALGEGLETAFWRVDDGRVRWLGVDLPEASALRRAALPAHERHRLVEGSVLDDGWLDETAAAVADPAELLVLAQGLFMYLQPGQVHALIARCGGRFPGARLLFDAVPPWTSAVTRSRRPVTRGGMVPPEMPWSMSRREATALRALPGVAGLRRLHPPRGRGLLFTTVLRAVDAGPLAADVMLTVWRLDLG